MGSAHMSVAIAGATIYAGASRLAAPVTALSARSTLPASPDTPSSEQKSTEGQALSGTRGNLLAGATLTAASSADQEETDPLGLTEEEQKVVDELKKRDREVRAHEQAHAAVGGAYAGQPTYEYEDGPDGNRYAVGGSVSIDTSPISGDPEATIRKMEVVKRAALAPAEPSPQDRAVAAAADRALQQASAELQKKNQEEAQAETGGDGASLTSLNQTNDPAAQAANAYGQAAAAGAAVITTSLVQIAA
ncbi:MAG: hypothetical protein KJ904_12510 [Alphaproteobacteria bacterium]|nr:hypothetical protein [Alphaproteobacteria bacterium]MBU0799184.1 hypothetical protein [Alphaproteobacteria bacterium]MBU0887975.1 hypothetical protein [Alphaproteobacteria bacterium]MBU1814802.1 hypothetical protein [Alphaproteobacteria bacterium]